MNLTVKYHKQLGLKNTNTQKDWEEVEKGPSPSKRMLEPDISYSNNFGPWRCGSAGRMLSKLAWGCGFNPQPCTNQAWWTRPADLSSWEEEEEFSWIFSYITSSGIAWATWNPASKSTDILNLHSGSSTSLPPKRTSQSFLFQHYRHRV